MITRTKLKLTDIEAFEDILTSSGFFYDFEIPVAISTAQENLDKGEEASGYYFIVVEEQDKAIAFACYGMAPCTVDSYDLYWIAVHADFKGQGIGKILMKLVEEDVTERGGKKIWIETSSRPLYEPTRQFYLNLNCEFVAELPDFYADTDSKVVFLKKL